MRHSLLVLLGVLYVVVGDCQTLPDTMPTIEVDYPYNPDSNGDELIGSSDLLNFLPVYEEGFQPQSIMVDSITLEAWLWMLQARLDSLEMSAQSGFNRDDVVRWVFGKELAGTDFKGLDLRYSEFQHADLQGANFANALLQGADLRWADMTGANFYGVDFGPNNDCVRYTPPFTSNSAVFNASSQLEGANLRCLRGCGCLPPGWVCTIDPVCEELRYRWVQPAVEGEFLYSDSVYDGESFRGKVFLPGPEGASSVTGSSFVDATISATEMSSCAFDSCDFTNARIDTSITSNMLNCSMTGFQTTEWGSGDFINCTMDGAVLNFADGNMDYYYSVSVSLQYCMADVLRLGGSTQCGLATGNQIERLEIASGLHPVFGGFYNGPSSQIDSLFVLGEVGVTGEELYQEYLEQSDSYVQSVWLEQVGIEYVNISNANMRLEGGTNNWGYGNDIVSDSLVIEADSSLVWLSSLSAHSVDLTNCKLYGNWSGLEVSDYFSLEGCDASEVTFERIDNVAVCPETMPDGWVCVAADEACGGDGPFVIRSEADSLQTVQLFGSDGDVLDGCDAFLNTNYSYSYTLFDSINVILPDQYGLSGSDYSGFWEFDDSQFDDVTIQGSCWNPVIGGCDNGIHLSVLFNECDFFSSDLQLSERADVFFDGGQFINSNVELTSVNEGMLQFQVDSTVNSEIKAKDMELFLGVAENLTVDVEDWVGLYSGDFAGLTISAGTVELADAGPISLDGCSISADEVVGYSDNVGLVTEILQGITSEAWDEGLQFQLSWGGGPIESVVLESVSSCPVGIQFPFVCSDDAGQVVVSVEF